jgi:NTP pyrophosphatase (non-canonical NTP hydrolase)
MKISITEEYQKQVLAGLKIDGGVDPIAHLALGIAGEAGEVADIVKKSQYAENKGTLDWVQMYRELGDVLWYVTAMAGKCGWTLDQVMRANIMKLAERHPDWNVYDVRKL